MSTYRPPLVKMIGGERFDIHATRRTKEEAQSFAAVLRARHPSWAVRVVKFPRRSSMGSMYGIYSRALRRPRHLRR